MANDKTGLAQDDVFYFGNAIGETGNSAQNANVNSTDIGLVRGNLSGFFTVGILNLYDINRDGRVNSTDIGLVRSNLSGFFPIQLITPVTSSSAAAVRVPATVKATRGLGKSITTKGSRQSKR